MESNFLKDTVTWRLISVARWAAGNSHQALASQLVEAHMALKQFVVNWATIFAIKAVRKGKLPFPDCDENIARAGATTP
jgi:hypothetical protein